MTWQFTKIQKVIVLLVVVCKDETGENIIVVDFCLHCSYHSGKLNSAYLSWHDIQCAAKKVSLKFFVIFLETAPNFYIYYSFLHLLLVHNRIKFLSSFVLFLIVTKLLNFFGDHVVISDVHGMFAERKTHHIL